VQAVQLTPPVPPQLAVVCSLDVRHCPLASQQPLSQESALQMHCPLVVSHVCPVGQELMVQAHCPLLLHDCPVGQDEALHMHAPVALQTGVVPVHDTQRPFVVPHDRSFPAPVPATHVPLLQHPPLHVEVHASLQAPLRHASFCGHWLSAAHTHVPEAVHWGVFPVQTAHVPLVPQASFAAVPVPAEHVPDVASAAIEQQPPLHVPTHVVPHAPPTHAWFARH